MRWAAAMVAGAAVVAALPAPAATVAAMRGRARILVVAAPSAADPRLAAQRRMLANWRRGAADRDVAVVEIAGNRVGGAKDSAADLRHRYALDAGRFAILLIGKDGHVALREAAPIASARLEAAIDAMPMRRAGER